MKKITTLMLSALGLCLNSQINLSGNQTITSRSFNDNVIVKAGANIKFNGNFNISPNKSILIEADGILEINNSTLDCGSGRWNGIRMIGDNSCMGKFNSYLAVKNSTIKNAIIAIRNVEDNAVYSNLQGGCVYIDNGNFEENCNYVEIYRNKLGKCNLDIGIFKSRFEMANFSCPSNSVSPRQPQHCVYLENASYLIEGNSFYFPQSIPQGKIQLGMKSCENIVKGNNFYLSDLGINVEATNKPSVKNSSLLNNFIVNYRNGIKIQDGNTDVTNNQMNHDPAPSGGSGLEINSLFYGRNLGNKFFVKSGGAGPVSMRLRNLGTGHNTIDNAQFKVNFNANKNNPSVLAIGNMRGRANGFMSGLKMDCSDFTVHYRHAFMVDNGGAVRQEFNTVTLDPITQLPIIYPAGNKFISNEPSYNKIDNKGSFLDYFWNANVSVEFPDKNINTNIVFIYLPKPCGAAFLKSAGKIEYESPQKITEMLLHKMPCGFVTRLIPVDKILTGPSKVSLRDYVISLNDRITIEKNILIGLKNQIPLPVEEISLKNTIVSGLAEERYSTLDVLAKDLLARESLDLEANVNQIVQTFKDMEHPTADIRLAEYYGSKGQYPMAMQAVIGINTRYTDLHDDELYDYSKYLDYYSIMNDMAMGNRDEYSLNNTDIIRLTALKNLDKIIAPKLRAEGILNDYDAAIMSQSNTLSSGDFIQSIFPNPSDNNTTVELALPEGYGSVQICIYDFNGNKKKTIDVPANTSSLTISTQDLIAGSYIVALEKNQQILTTKNLAIAH
jgi:hypothetical protein